MAEKQREPLAQELVVWRSGLKGWLTYDDQGQPRWFRREGPKYVASDGSVAWSSDLAEAHAAPVKDDAGAEVPVWHLPMERLPGLRAK